MCVCYCEVIVVIALVQLSGSPRELLGKISFGREFGGVVHIQAHACLYIYIYHIYICVYKFNYVRSCGCACGYILMADKMLVPGF